MSVPAAIYEHYPGETYAFGYYPTIGRQRDARVAGETATLDASGKLTLERAVRARRRLRRIATRSRATSRTSRASTSRIARAIVVHPAPWYIGLRRPGYFADTTTGTSVDVVAVDHEGDSRRRRATCTSSLIRIQWNSVRRAEGSGFYTWETERSRRRRASGR